VKIERCVLTTINDDVMLKICIEEMMRIFRTKTKFMKLVIILCHGNENKKKCGVNRNSDKKRIVKRN